MVPFCTTHFSLFSRDWDVHAHIGDESVGFFHLTPLHPTAHLTPLHPTAHPAPSTRQTPAAEGRGRPARSWKRRPRIQIGSDLAGRWVKKWVWLKIKQGQTAGFGPCFQFPGFPILEFRFLEQPNRAPKWNPGKVEKWILEPAKPGVWIFEPRPAHKKVSSRRALERKNLLVPTLRLMNRDPTSKRWRNAWDPEGQQSLIPPKVSAPSAGASLEMRR